MSGFWKIMFISMHSILGWDSFCIAAWKGGNPPVALLRCNGSPGCFDSGLQAICIVGSGVSLPLFLVSLFLLILCLSTLAPDTGTLISKWNAKYTFIWNEDFGPLTNSPVLFLLSPGKMLLTMFLFQKWFGSLFLKMSERGDSWCTDSRFSSLLVKFSQVFESQFLPSSQLCI